MHLDTSAGDAGNLPEPPDPKAQTDCSRNVPADFSPRRTGPASPPGDSSVDEAAGGFRLTYDSDARSALRGSIKQHGRNLSPILKQRGTGRTLDGAVREQICKELGIEPWFVEIDCTEDEFDYLRAELNHLTDIGTQSQKAMRTVRLLYARVSEEAARRRTHLPTGVLEARESPDDGRTDDETGETRKIIARHAGVSIGLVGEAIAVWKADPVLAHRVETRDLSSIGAALREIERRANPSNREPLLNEIGSATRAVFEQIGPFRPPTSIPEDGACLVEASGLPDPLTPALAARNAVRDDGEAPATDDSIAGESEEASIMQRALADCTAVELPADRRARSMFLADLMIQAADASRRIYVITSGRFDKVLLRMLGACTDALYAEEFEKIILGFNVSTMLLIENGLKGVVVGPILASLSMPRKPAAKEAAYKWPRNVPRRIGPDRAAKRSDEFVAWAREHTVPQFERIERGSVTSRSFACSIRFGGERASVWGESLLQLEQKIVQIGVAEEHARRIVREFAASALEEYRSAPGDDGSIAEQKRALLEALMRDLDQEGESYAA